MDCSAQLVGHPNGAVVPADTPAVAAAKAAFFHAGGVIHPVAGIAHAPVAYAAGPLVSHANGAVVPADTPDVVAARAANAAAGGAIHPVAAVPYAYVHHGLVAHPNGALVPAEPADVVAAREAHLAAVAEAGRKKREAQTPVNLVTGLTATSYINPWFGHHLAVAPVTSPFTAYPNGALVPEEPADVAEARAAHLEALAAASK